MSNAYRALLPGALFLVLAGLWAAAISGPHVSARASWLDGLESTLLDVRFRVFGPVAPVPEVALVVIDDATLGSPDQAGKPGRVLIAETVNAIGAAQPQVIGLDIIFADPGEPEADARLAAALRRAPTVIAAGARFAQDRPASDVPRPNTVLRPQPIFAAAADVALVNLSTDVRGVPRHVPLVFATELGVEPAFALTMASRFLGEEPQIAAHQLDIGTVSVPLDVGLTMPIRLVGAEGQVPTYSAADVLSGAVSDALRGRAVILGYTATGFGDRFPSAFDEDVPGVEILGGVVSQMIGGATLRRDAGTRKLDAVAGFGLALVSSVLILALPLVWGLPAALGLILGWGAVVFVAFGQGVWLGGALPLAASIVPVAGAVVLRYYTEKRKAAQGAKALAALKQFQSPQLAELIASDPSFLRTPTSKSLVILFVDLSSFTGLSERLGPARTQDLLKGFHQITATTVEAEDGIVLNYMGDGALAVFGMVGDSQISADQAWRTSFALLEGVATLGGPDYDVGCRIGLHYGEVVMSRLGGDRHQQVSVAGDSVNLASRLLEIAKAEGASIAATEDFVGRVTGVEVSAKVKTVPVRGRAGGAKVHFWSV